MQRFLPGGRFAILPLTGNRSCITWTESADRAREILALDDAGFLREVERRFDYRLGSVALAGPLAGWPLDMHLARALVANRFALISDAAHGVHPIAGQGLNLGLRDVAALAEVIADAARLGLDFGSLATLERYERWRRLHSAISAAAFDALNRLFSNDVTVLRTARDFGLGLVDRMPGLKQLFVAEAAGLTGEVPKLLEATPSRNSVSMPGGTLEDVRRLIRSPPSARRRIRGPSMARQQPASRAGLLSIDGGLVRRVLFTIGALVILRLGGFAAARHQSGHVPAGAARRCVGRLGLGSGPPPLDFRARGHAIRVGMRHHLRDRGLLVAAAVAALVGPDGNAAAQPLHPRRRAGVDGL